MDTIVEQNEKADQKSCRHHRECQCPKIGKVVPDREDHQVPQAGVRDQRIDKLPNRLAAARGAVRVQRRARVRPRGIGLHMVSIRFFPVLRPLRPTALSLSKRRSKCFQSLEFIFGHLLAMLWPLIPSGNRVPGILLWKIDVVDSAQGVHGPGRRARGHFVDTRNNKARTRRALSSNNWCPETGSNRRHGDFQFCAPVPQKYTFLHNQSLTEMEPHYGPHKTALTWTLWGHLLVLYGHAPSE